jgi:cobalt/nickel transport system ATP-binding protein
LIIAEEVSFFYPDGTKALDNLSLTILASESAGIVGANGAGKSTLVNHLNGYFLPHDGKISIGGLVINKKNIETIRQQVGLVFQNPDDQLFTASLYDDVLFGPLNLGMKREDVDGAAEQLLRNLGLWELRDKPPSRLSQGQKRFAAFAAVLVMQPTVLVMDEPTSDLDPRNRRKLINLVNSLQSTKITVSHDLDFIWDTCDRVYIMAEGKITTHGAAREILGNRGLLEANGLELPLRLQG